MAAGVTSVTARVSSPRPGSIELRLDSSTGPVIGTFDVPDTDGWNNFTTITQAIRNASGVHDLYLVWNISKTGDPNVGHSDVDWFQFVGNGSK